MKKIIFRADDLGYSEGVNLGIAKTIKKGLVRTAGLIVNLEHSQEGFELIKDEDICLGLHVNISCGRPVSETAVRHSLLDENGMFKSSREYNNALTDFVSYDEVYEEVEAQYFCFKEITGREPDYIEGHAVFNRTYFRAIEAAARKYQLQYIPTLLSSDDYFKIKSTRVYFWMESMNADYDPYQTFRKLCLTKREGVEVMICHPGFIDDELLECSSLLLPRVREVQFLTGKDLVSVMKRQQIELTTYKELERR